MEPQPLRKFARVLGSYKRHRIVVDEVVEACQKKSQRSAGRKLRQSVDLGVSERTSLAICGNKRTALRDVKAVALEAPGIEHHRDVVGECVVAGEVEVDKSRDLAFHEEHVVGKEVGVDHALR